MSRWVKEMLMRWMEKGKINEDDGELAGLHQGRRINPQ